jgi:hypothetical protein
MRRYTVQVTSPCINWGEPNKPLYWHWSVEARSEAEALATVRNSRDCRGMPARIVLPLG